MTSIFEEYEIPKVPITLVRLNVVKELDKDDLAILRLLWDRFDETAQSVLSNTISDATSSD